MSGMQGDGPKWEVSYIPQLLSKVVRLTDTRGPYLQGVLAGVQNTNTSLSVMVNRRSEGLGRIYLAQSYTSCIDVLRRQAGA